MKYRIELHDAACAGGRNLDDPASEQRYPTFMRASSAARLAALKLARIHRTSVGIRIYDRADRLTLQASVGEPPRVPVRAMGYSRAFDPEV
ncbi:hypothetical protein LY625_01005 [Lysobacter sp. GX 14042]|uniref:hypothetical protein n=1 Tax=Lysobacter sp. GX 14042 TaxID=2907155 RepID=UPI001F30FEE9|nr:hypothetical protein [Lysobacter sp. GX 14042]MCE7031217.1 hypothetical protein [Lysobacter sp. GX 14042]